MVVAVRTSVAPEPAHHGERLSGARTGAAPQHHRGPMRPGALTSARRRLTGGMLGRVLRLLDAVVLLASIGLAALVYGERGLWANAAAAALAFVAIRLVGAYRYDPGETAGVMTLRVIGAVAAAAALASLAHVAAALPIEALPAWAAIAGVLLTATHLGALVRIRSWRAQGRLTPNIVVVGATENAQRLVEAAMSTRDVAVLGVFDDRSDRIAPTVHGVPVLGDTHALLAHRILPYVDRIVLTVNAAGPARTAELIERLRVLPNELCLFLDSEDPASRSTTLNWLARSTLSVGGARARDNRRLVKRTQDIILASLLLIPALPLMALIALLVRLDSPGPVLFRQRRHGFNNEEIVVWKFRSMRTELGDPTGARQVTLADDRVTRVGRVIRMTSLDELPQLFNVLSGEMSLVGPRPHPVGMKTGGEESARLVSEYAWRHRMKPGITGWAQIHGSRGPVHTAEEVRRRVELDVDYIERQSLWLDLYILAMTLPRLLGDGEAIR